MEIKENRQVWLVGKVKNWLGRCFKRYVSEYAEAEQQARRSAGRAARRWGGRMRASGRGLDSC